MKFKVALTSDCNLRCSYCFIDKLKGETMSEFVAERTARRIMASPGAHKSIAIYGGEPMIHFAALARLIETARACSVASKQGLSLSVATNGLLLRRHHLRFFRERDVRVCISAGGSVHDHSRRDTADRGTAAATAAAMTAAAKELPERLLTALLCVGPDNAREWDRDARALARRGFTRVNLEIIQGVAWTPEQRRGFERAFTRFARWLSVRARGTSPVYLQSVDRHLARLLRVVAQDVVEISPDGRRRRVAYPFAHRPGLKRAGRGAEVLAERERLSSDLAESLLRGAKKHARYYGYVREAVTKASQD